MKKLLIIIMTIIPFFGIAQESQTITVVNKNEILFKYTFEGMKSANDTTNLVNAVKKLQGVSEVAVIFKSAEHQYAQLKVKVKIPETQGENTQDITGPSNLKKVLIELGYVPAECKTIVFEKN